MLTLYNYKKKIFCTIAALCFITSGFAQEEMYHGGYDDGYSGVAVNNFSPALLNHFVAYTSTLSDDGYSAAEHHNYNRQFITQYTPYTSGMMDDGYAGTIAFNQVLPIQLISFEGSRINKTSLIRWKVADEADIASYDLERSNSGNAFTLLHNQIVLTPSSFERQREYIDANPFPGNNFYRLKINDKDGNYEYSNIVLVIFSEQNSLVVYPNPTKEYFIIDAAQKIINAELIDMTGRRIKYYKPSVDNRYSIQGITTGMYMLNIYTSGQKTSVKIMVQ